MDTCIIIIIVFRFSSDKSQKEGKVTLADGSWVTLTLTDTGGRERPTLKVAREKAAITWIEQVFPELCARIPGNERDTKNL